MLRTDLFKTVDRVDTRFIAVRDTLTRPGLEPTIRELDVLHCKQGRLGLGGTLSFLALVQSSLAETSKPVAPIPKDKTLYQ